MAGHRADRPIFRMQGRTPLDPLQVRICSFEIVSALHTPAIQPTLARHSDRQDTDHPVASTAQFTGAEAAGAGAGTAGSLNSLPSGVLVGLSPLDDSSISQKNIIPTPKIATAAMPIRGPRCHLFCFSMLVWGADMVLPFCEPALSWATRVQPLSGGSVPRCVASRFQSDAVTASGRSAAMQLA